MTDHNNLVMNEFRKIDGTIAPIKCLDITDDKKFAYLNADRMCSVHSELSIHFKERLI